MKTKNTIPFALLVFVFCSCGSFTELQSQPQGRVDMQMFYDQLSPYGHWFEYPPHGYAWRPNVGGDFVPYRSNGHWAWSEEYEWIWVSDYPWGWAPFHYGRWHFDNQLNWIWVPGYEWSPAWVTWRSNSDYYGWAPLDIGITVGFSLNNYNPPSFYWNFVSGNALHNKDLKRYYINRNQNQDFFRKTQPLFRDDRRGAPSNQRRSFQFYFGGPVKSEYEQRSRINLKPVRIRESDRPGQSRQNQNEIKIYKPPIYQNPGGNAKPKTISPMEVLKKKIERKPRG